MSKSPIETIQAKAKISEQAVAGLRKHVADVAANEESRSKEISEAVILLAQAEGEQRLWARLDMVASRHDADGIEFTLAVANQLVVNLLSEGADDRWSGRGNDVARASFDGLRSAASDVQYIF